MGAFIKHDDLRSAVFAASPLVQRRKTNSVGFAVAWVFAGSATMARSVRNELPAAALY